MKRHRYGMNLDEGIPLQSPEDFELLYLDLFPQVVKRLDAWLSKGDGPLLLGGQIGSGKTTLIQYALRTAARQPDVVLHFDQDSLNMDQGDFLAILLTGLIRTALQHPIDLDFCALPAELAGLSATDWQGLLDALATTVVSMAAFTQMRALRQNIAGHHEYIVSVSTELGQRIADCLGRPLWIFASGLDKFYPGSAAFLSMAEAIAILRRHKTLFEVNAAHLFATSSSPLHGMESLLIPAAAESDITELLCRRMGVYGEPIRQTLGLLAQWSGGNPRQAIRLLAHFEAVRHKPHRNLAEQIALAIRETTGDYFAAAPRPSAELIEHLAKSGKINPAWFSLPGDKETARSALYGNWFFLNAFGADGYWAITVNPLIRSAFSDALPTDAPEVRLLRDYAQEYGISAQGLGPSRWDEAKQTEKSGEQLLWEILASGVEHPIHTHLTETLDILGAALLSKDRADRTIIAFKNPDILEPARAYLLAKANSYEYQRCEHIRIVGNKSRHCVSELLAFLQQETDIYSVEFDGCWPVEQLDLLDKLRDGFLEKEMLWWIPFAALKTYLPHWIQLRQLFEVFVLEDELLGSLSTQDIEADLAFFEALAETQDSAEAGVVANLRKVLDYLRQTAEAKVGHG